MSAPALGYRPALDGVRAVAILAVLARHSGLIAGGYLGVDVFFALSGFLITTLLVEEYSETGTITLRLFYARRGLRLLPALLALVIVVTIVHFATLPAEFGPLVIHEAAAALLYTANYAWVIDLPLGLYSHAWSLAIEEQFYLIWPVLLLGLLRTVRRRILFSLTLAGAVAGFAWRAWLVASGARFEHIYQGLDAHGDGLLIGCAVALAVAEGIRGRIVARVGGVLGLSSLVAVIGVATFPSSYLRNHASTVVAVATALVIIGVVLEPGSWLARVLAVRPFAMLGRISYGVYLWHFPVFNWCGGLDLSDINLQIVAGWPQVLASWAATFAIAGVSYILVERPALALKATIRAGTARTRSEPLIGSAPTNTAVPGADIA